MCEYLHVVYGQTIHDNEIKREILVTLQGHQKNSSDIIIIPIKYLAGSPIAYDEDVYKPTNRRSLQMR
jgi:hypothetical protein